MIRSTLAAVALAVAVAVFGPAAPALAAPHDCRTTARAAETVEDAAALAQVCGEPVTVDHDCPCGKRWETDGSTWSRR